MTRITSVNKNERLDTHHLCQSAGSHNVSSMNEAVEVTGGFLNLLAKVIVGIKVKHVGDQIKRVLIVLDLGVETGQVESIGEIFLVNFAKVLIATRGYELRDKRTFEGKLGLFTRTKRERKTANILSDMICGAGRRPTRSHLEGSCEGSCKRGVVKRMTWEE